MEVKNIFFNHILRSYDKQDEISDAVKRDPERIGYNRSSDPVNISPNASQRLFGDLMEHSLKKGLSEVLIDEN
ncbi:MAG TPA: hypothetical protein ENN34_06430 [Deltaproteobacteria bacterium]|nr:hypothetical protein [Deltaproteobacteria bacterium]